MAAWRYGARFGARWRRQLGLAVGGAALVGGYIVAGPVMGLVAGGIGTVPWNLAMFGQGFIRRRRVVVRIERPRGTVVLTDEHIRGARLVPVPKVAHGWRLNLPHLADDRRLGSFTRRSTHETDTHVELVGDEALAAARAILPRLNRWGGRKQSVDDAVRILELAPSADASFARVAQDKYNDGSTLLLRVGTPYRLALEMAAHEEIERRALEGELALIEEAWREAEEVAAIADSLTLPERIGAHLDRLRG